MWYTVLLYIFDIAADPTVIKKDSVILQNVERYHQHHCS